METKIKLYYASKLTHIESMNIMNFLAEPKPAIAVAVFVVMAVAMAVAILLATGVIK